MKNSLRWYYIGLATLLIWGSASILYANPIHTSHPGELVMEFSPLEHRVQLSVHATNSVPLWSHAAFLPNFRSFFGFLMNPQLQITGSIRLHQRFELCWGVASQFWSYFIGIKSLLYEGKKRNVLHRVSAYIQGGIRAKTNITQLGNIPFGLIGGTWSLQLKKQVKLKLGLQVVLGSNPYIQPTHLQTNQYWITFLPQVGLQWVCHPIFHVVVEAGFPVLYHRDIPPIRLEFVWNYPTFLWYMELGTSNTPYQVDRIAGTEFYQGTHVFFSNLYLGWGISLWWKSRHDAD
jgi:hypothetical protein